MDAKRTYTTILAVCGAIIVFGPLSPVAGQTSSVPSEATPPPGTTNFEAVKAKADFWASALESLDAWAVTYQWHQRLAASRREIQRRMPHIGGLWIVARVEVEKDMGDGLPRHRRLGNVIIGPGGATPELAWKKFEEEEMRPSVRVAPAGTTPLDALTLQERLDDFLRYDFEKLKKEWYPAPFVLPAPPDPAERHRLEQQLGRLLTEQRETFERAQAQLDAARARLERERDNLIDKTVQNRKNKQENVDNRTRASRNVERLERDVRSLRQRVADLAGSIARDEAQLNSLRGQNDHFLAAFGRHMEIDIKRGQGVMYVFVGRDCEFYPNVPLHLGPTRKWGPYITEFYNRVLDYVRTQGEFPPVIHVNPDLDRHVIRLTKGQFDTFNANAREIRRLSGEVATHKVNKAIAETEVAKLTTEQVAAVADVRKHEAMLKLLDARDKEIVNRRAKYAAAVRKLEEGEGENRFRRQFIEMAQRALQRRLLVQDHPSLSPRNPVVLPSAPAAPAPRNPVVAPLDPPEPPPRNPLAAPGRR